MHVTTYRVQLGQRAIVETLLEPSTILELVLQVTRVTSVAPFLVIMQATLQVTILVLDIILGTILVRIQILPQLLLETSLGTEQHFTQVTIPVTLLVFM